MAFLNKKCGKSNQPAEGYQAWKNALRLFGIDTIWYTIDQFQEFTCFVRNKVMNQKMRRLGKVIKNGLPKWVTFKPVMYGIKTHQMHYV
jgi:hypothetical protein